MDICLNVYIGSGQMKKVCMLITKPPHSGEGAERICGISAHARASDMEVVIYLIGDGVLCAKRNQTGHMGHHVQTALAKGVEVVASRDDLLARGLAETQVEPGVEMVEDIEGRIVTDVMEHADRVISW